MRQTLLALFVFGLGIGGLVAIDRAEAQTSEAYTPRDGYFWKGSVAYTRTKVYLPVEYYVENGYKYAHPQKYYWKYTLAPVNNVTFPHTSNWQERADALQAAIAKYNSDARVLAIDRDSYVKTKALLNSAIGEVNLSGGVGSLRFGERLQYQGNTTYGPSAYGNYSVNSAQALIATSIDMNLWAQANARTLDRHVSGSVDLMKLGQEAFVAIAQENARLAALRPNQAIQASAGAAGAGANARVAVNPGIGATGPVPDGSNFATPRTGGRPQAIINAACIRCHSGAAAKGGADLTNVNALTTAQWREVVRRTQLVDNTRMPPPAEPQLTPEQKDEIRLAQ